MYQLGRLMQLAGMIILPIAIAGQATEALTQGQMLTWAGVGVLVFGAGWMLQQKAGKK